MTAYYYDAEGHLLQEVSENSVGGMSRRDLSYDMPGRLLWSRGRHSDGLGVEHVLEWSTGYDMYGRQMGVIVSLDSLRPYSEMYVVGWRGCLGTVFLRSCLTFQTAAFVR